MTAEDDEEEDEDEEDEEEEDEDEDDEDSEDDDDEDVLEEGDSEMIPYEAIRDADQEDIVPVEKTTVNDKVRARSFISHLVHSSCVLTCPDGKSRSLSNACSLRSRRTPASLTRSR